MLETTRGTGRRPRSVFLPAELVLGVARQLVSSGAWTPGGSASRPPTPPTTVAAVGTVDHPAAADGAAGGRSRATVRRRWRLGGRGRDHRRRRLPGPIEAELRTRLYADPPGTDLTVTFDRGGATMTTSVVLADPDADAPEGRLIAVA